MKKRIGILLGFFLALVAVTVSLYIWISQNGHNSNKYKVWSFNLRSPGKDDKFTWEERKGPVIKLIHEAAPDIIGFQEVTEQMYSDLKSALGSTYQSYGFMRSPDKNSEMTPIFVNKNKFMVKECGHFFLSETPEIDYSKGWDGKHPRVASWMALADKQSGKNVAVVINTHFDHKGIKAQTHSGELIGLKAKELGSKFNVPVVVEGDFNSSPVDQSMMNIWNSGKWMDSYHTLPAEEQGDSATSHHFEGTTFGKPIDYISVEDPFKILKSKIIRTKVNGVWPSDHYPIEVIFK